LPCFPPFSSGNNPWNVTPVCASGSKRIPKFPTRFPPFRYSPRAQNIHHSIRLLVNDLPSVLLNGCICLSNRVRRRRGRHLHSRPRTDHGLLFPSQPFSRRRRSSTSPYRPDPLADRAQGGPDGISHAHFVGPDIPFHTHLGPLGRGGGEGGSKTKVASIHLRILVFFSLPNFLEIWSWHFCQRLRSAASLNCKSANLITQALVRRVSPPSHQPMGWSRDREIVRGHYDPHVHRGRYADIGNGWGGDCNWAR